MLHAKPVLCIGPAPTVQRTMKFRKLAIDEVNRAVEVLESAAGKSIHVARVLNTLGKPVVATGFLGGDSGRFLGDQLDHEGIRRDFVEVPFRTRTCTTVINMADGTTTELVEESKVVEEKYWRQLLDRVAGYAPQCSAMVLSGGLPPQSPQDFYARCCEIAKSPGIPVIMDTRGEPLRQAMPWKPALVKPNRAELGEMLKEPVETDAQLKQAVEHLLGRGAQAALITMGAKGAVFSDSTGFWFLAAPKVQTANPIGSGDSVAAGYTAGLIDGLPLLDCAILGIACGSANALTPIPGLVHHEDVQRLRQEIRPASL